MLDTIIVLCKAFGALILLMTIRMCYKQRVGVKRAQFYIDQGIAAVPGYKAFPFGNSKFAMNYFKKCDEVKGKSKLICIQHLTNHLL